MGAVGGGAAACLTLSPCSTSCSAALRSSSVELSSLSLCMTNSKQGEPCFYVIGRTETARLVTLSSSHKLRPHPSPAAAPLSKHLCISPLKHASVRPTLSSHEVTTGFLFARHLMTSFITVVWATAASVGHQRNCSSPDSLLLRP